MTTKVTKVAAGKARGVTKRTAPHTAKHIEDEKRKAPAKAKPVKRAAGGGKTFTTSELAAEMKMPSKTCVHAYAVK